MIKIILLSLLLTLPFLSFAEDVKTGKGQSAACSGKFPNPITDICWSCLFPVRIGAINIDIAGEVNNHDAAPPFICHCPAPPPLFIRYGVGISFWQPARISEVVRTPMCSPTLGGTVLGGGLSAPNGTHSDSLGATPEYSFYHVHWINFPVLNWLGIALEKGACGADASAEFDIAYLSELDPLWDDDELTYILNPEAVLFANPVAQAACVADSVSAIATNFGIDALFWCAGSQGSVFPIDGSSADHVGGVDTSLLETQKMIFKLHREMLAQDTSTLGAMCGAIPQPVMRKGQYKQQMLYPISQTHTGLGFGVPSTIWGSGKEFPYKGENFTYMIWRKNMLRLVILISLIICNGAYAEQYKEPALSDISKQKNNAIKIIDKASSLRESKQFVDKLIARQQQLSGINSSQGLGYNLPHSLGGNADYVNKALAAKSSINSYQSFKPNPLRPIVLVSLSMPKATVKSLMDEAHKIGAAIAIRGLVDDSVEKTLAALKKAVGNDIKTGILIDSTLFRRFNVKTVPTFILPLDPVKRCTSNICPAPEFIKAEGTATLRYFLEKVGRVGSKKEQALAKVWVDKYE